ncbi:MAG: hypothetical protein WBD05_03045 [Phycisphaerae bacterium]
MEPDGASAPRRSVLPTILGVLLAVLNVAAVVFGLLMLAWARIENRGVERWGVIYVFFICCCGLAVEVLLLLPATIIFLVMTRGRLSAWFRWSALAALSLAILVVLGVQACLFYDL